MSQMVQETARPAQASVLERALQRTLYGLGIFFISAAVAILLLVVIIIVVWIWIRIGISVRIFAPTY